jgi:hypothetical protein
MDDLANNRTVVLTACGVNEGHRSSFFPAPLSSQPTADFPHWVRSFIDGHNIIGTAEDADRNSGTFNNNIIDLTELRDSIQARYGNPPYNNPQIGDAGRQATNVYPINVIGKTVSTSNRIPQPMAVLHDRDMFNQEATQRLVLWLL